MPARFKPKLEILPKAQIELWPRLAPMQGLNYVLYGGTAVALHLGHRISLDFDFFRSESLDKHELLEKLPFLAKATTIQEEANTLVVGVAMPDGPVKVSFFGGLDIGRVNEPLETDDAVLLVASLDDLMATKLKTILDRAEAKDYRDISEMLAAGVSLEKGLGAFSQMFGKDAGLPLRALGFFRDGDLGTLPKADQDRLRQARDRVSTVPHVSIVRGSLAQ